MWSCPEKLGGKTSLRLMPALLSAAPNFLTSTRADSPDFADMVFFFGRIVVANRNEPVKCVTGFKPWGLRRPVFLDALATKTFSLNSAAGANPQSVLQDDIGQRKRGRFFDLEKTS